MIIAVSSEQEHQELIEALRHIHNSDIDTDIPMVNELAHMYLVPERITVGDKFEQIVTELDKLIKPLYMDEDDELNSEYNCAIRDAIYMIEKIFQRNAEPIIADKALDAALDGRGEWPNATAV